jgi:alpha-glucosidase (family GH31 glycosyl hydrolase)
MVCIISIELNSNYFILGKTVFPDYFYPPTKDWWKNQILNYYQKIKFDALWIDMK